MDLAAVAERFGLARLTRHGELVLQREAPFVTMGRARVQLPPASFLQADRGGRVQLWRGWRWTWWWGLWLVADLFCGVRHLRLRLAETHKVAAFENNAPAVAAMVRAGQATAGLRQVDGEVRDLFRRPLMAEELARFEAVVIDPPPQESRGACARTGEGKARAHRLCLLQRGHLRAGCTPSHRRGFHLREVTPVDQFPLFPHVELVGRFER